MSNVNAANGAEPRPRWTYPEHLFEPDFHAPELALKPLDQVEPKQLVWEGPGGYAPRGSVTIIAGEHGSGKTHLAIDWAARVSKGYPAFGKSAGRRAAEKAARRSVECGAARASTESNSSSDSREFNLEGPWLDNGRPVNIVPSEAVIAHAGDLTVDELRRRIDAAGGSPERIAAVSLNWPDGEQQFAFSTIQKRVLALACAIRGSGDVRLLVVDNLEALAGNMHETPSAALTGFLLSNLAEVAARANIAIVVLAHLPRGGGQAAARKLDAYCNAAPVVYLAASDAERPNRKLLVTVKNTLGPAAPARAFEIVDRKVVIREELPAVSADEFIVPLSRRLEARHERETAARWLLAALADGPVASRDLFRQARECGIATKTLRRAAESLGLSPRKSSFDGPWQWKLDESSAERGAESAGQPPAGAAMQATIEDGQVRAAAMASSGNGEPEASASGLHRAAQRLDRCITPTPETEAHASGSPTDGAGSPIESREDGHPC
ncbi:MAG TPA: AAA family ATPase, partial [Pirellulales bacterium]|nr:AAA family ATPase [Pirellulales bacterium]